MLKLSKYEFRKNRNVLIIIAVGLILLEAYFLFSCLLKKSNNTILLASLLLYIYAMVCFFMVFVLAISNYSKELSSKSSYLIFMTPNPALNIIVSKMFTILIIGIVTAAIFFGIVCLDFHVLSMTYSNISEFKNVIKLFATMSNIDLAQLALTVLSYILEFLISFFATVTLVYLAITLSATLFQNHRLKGVISTILFFIMTFIVNKITGLLPVIYSNSDLTITQTLINLVPPTLFNLVIMIGCMFGCAALLEKKVSL
jgi:hypothetical protein